MLGRAVPLASPLDAARFAPAARRRLGGPGLRAFQHIADLWRLTEAERLLVLGLPSRSTFYGWLKAAEVTLPVDVLLRISAVLGIHKALRILFETEAEGAAWLRAANAALPFAGQAPLALITGGTQDGLMQVRRFLDAARGGLHMAPNAADEAPPWRDDDIVIA
ncbi:hypothetical protein DFH01_02760 [Falsiroseomonas bella]|uniref:Uncharacterized protein n=1 Tax=Falsiroseomonas bella TaxID=2184016 RepID=A0A317FHG4_9PROT|nr:antitoxin Xre/MbcA/ParS toxin-binding domain-containing protein [Falsiroseomonas bella]PWS38235.1 hypothetical protein DFH01_02760 [Falsiroseomonas bella]